MQRTPYGVQCSYGRIHSPAEQGNIGTWLPEKYRGSGRWMQAIRRKRLTSMQANWAFWGTQEAAVSNSILSPVSAPADSQPQEVKSHVRDVFFKSLGGTMFISNLYNQMVTIYRDRWLKDYDMSFSCHFGDNNEHNVNYARYSWLIAVQAVFCRSEWQLNPNTSVRVQTRLFFLILSWVVCGHDSLSNWIIY